MYVGSSISVRGFARLGSSLSAVSTTMHAGSLVFGNGYGVNTILVDSGPTRVSFKAQSLASPSSNAHTVELMKFESGDSTLKGSGSTAWHADAYAVTSDRRYKRNVRNLLDSLTDMRRVRLERLGLESEALSLDNSNTTAEQQRQLAINDAVDEFRKVRPTGFYFSSDVQAKRTRFGFIAQELQELYPSAVETLSSGRMGVNYNDVLAILTLVLQERMKIADNLTQRAAEVAETVLKKQDSDVNSQAQRLEKLRVEIAGIRELHIKLEKHLREEKGKIVDLPSPKLTKKEKNNTIIEETILV